MLAQNLTVEGRARERYTTQQLNPSAQEPSAMDEDEDVRITTIDLRGLQRSERVVSRFSRVRERLKKLQQQFGIRRKETWEDEQVLWNADECELTDLMTSGWVRDVERSESPMRWEQLGFEDVDLRISGRVKVRSIV
jgi:hypothetical protein